MYTELLSAELQYNSQTGTERGGNIIIAELIQEKHCVLPYCITINEEDLSACC